MSGRCRACDKKLSDLELTSKIKSNLTGEIIFNDLCAQCTKTSDTEYVTIVKGKSVPIIEEVEED